MRPVSAGFLTAVRGSHHMAARARICAPGQTGTDPDGTEVPILAGDVQLDSTADIRSTLDLTTDGTGWTTRLDELITPYGNELFVERGIQFGDGSIEWVSLGYHRLYTVDQDQAPNGNLRISAKDRMSGLIDARLLFPIQFTIGTSVADIFDYLVLDVYPDADIEFDFDADTTALAGSSQIAEDDRFGFLADLVASLGKVWWWDYAGRLQIASPPDPSTPVFDVLAGEGGVLVSQARSLSRDQVYNAVVATGETPGQDSSVRAVAVDANPNSPTYWDGPYGKVPKFYSSPFIATQQQAAAAAESMLRQSLGLPYSVDFTAVPNPALEPLDPVRVRVRGEIHVIEKLTIPLTAGEALQANTREQTTVKIGISA